MRALLCDLDDTLIDRSAAFAAFAAELIARHGLPASALNTLITLDRASVGHLRRFTVGAVEGLALPITPEELGEQFLVAMAENATLYPGATQQLQRLRGRLRVAIVTNGGSRTQRTKLERTGLATLVDEVFVSAELGVEKPDPAIFAHALAWAGCASKEALFVGDDPLRDIAGAARAGMRTVWMSHGRAYPDGLPRPHHVLDNIAFLHTVLV